MRPRILARLIWCSLLFCLVLASPPRPAAARGQASQSEEAELRALVEQLYQRYARKDLEGYLGLWDIKTAAYERRREALRRYLSAMDRIELKRMSVGKPARNGEKASVRMQAL